MIVWLWMVGVMFVILVLMLGVGLCQAAAKPAPRIPKAWSAEQEAAYLAAAKSYAEGRPTMPSEVEPELERERRTR
jgi:hypothetical protein